MINGLGVLGWGVGGIEAEAAMLGQPVSMLIPQVVGFRLTGELPEGSTATDLVLTVTQMLRERGVVGQVRGVLRRGPRRAAAGRPRDDRQHGARVRRHLRDLPGRRRDAALPRVLRPPARAGRAGRGLLPRAGDVPRRGLRGRRLLRHARARPRRRGAVARRPQAPAGPRGAVGRRAGLPGRAGGARRRLGPRAGDTGRGGRGVLPRERPAGARRRRERRGAAHGAGARRRRAGARGARRRGSTTARW